MGEIKSLSEKLDAAEKKHFDDLENKDISIEELRISGNNLDIIDKEMQELKISDYSLINVNEFLAEAFTQAEIGTPGKYGKAVTDVIKRYFGR